MMTLERRSSARARASSCRCPACRVFSISLGTGIEDICHFGTHGEIVSAGRDGRAEMHAQAPVACVDFHVVRFRRRATRRRRFCSRRSSGRSGQGGRSRGQTNTFENVETICIRMLVEWIQVGSDRSGKQNFTGEESRQLREQQ